MMDPPRRTRPDLPRSNLSRKRRSLQAVREILPAALRVARIEQPIRDQKRLAVWPETVGEAVARQTRAQSLRHGTLTVRVSNSGWMHQLQFLKPQILEKLNRRLGGEPLREIRFKVGLDLPASSPAPGAEAPGCETDGTPGTERKMRPLSESDRRRIEISTRPISDPELRDLLARIGEKAFGLKHLPKD